MLIHASCLVWGSPTRRSSNSSGQLSGGTCLFTYSYLLVVALKHLYMHVLVRCRLTTLSHFCINHGKVVLQFEIIIQLYMSYLAISDSFEYICCYFSAGTDFRWQNLTCVDVRTDSDV